jgi:hypothetical protein
MKGGDLQAVTVAKCHTLRTSHRHDKLLHEGIMRETMHIAASERGAATPLGRCT